MSSSLPIAKFRDEIINSVRKHATTIIVGETGSGKSTQLPQYLQVLLTQGKRIACTQPRRVAAVSVAQRVAFEQKVKIGEQVGYAIRFEDVSSHKTKIKFVTDGVLLRECMVDSLLNDYDIVILDEAHERSLQTDILMGLLRQAQEKRPTLRVVVMSATLQIDLYLNFFKDGNVIKIAGRQFPVDVLYASQPVDDYVDAALLTCLQIHADEAPGGVLVFLPGQEDIEALMGLLEDHLPSIVSSKLKLMGSAIVTQVTQSEEPMTKKSRKSDTGVEVTASNLRNFEIAPLYAAMPAEDQMAALKPSASPDVRKFVLSTNIAETSVTISGIKYGMLSCSLTLFLSFSPSFVHCSYAPFVLLCSDRHGVPQVASAAAGHRRRDAEDRARVQGAGESARGSLGARVCGQMFPALHRGDIRG